ncbi:MAG: LamG domain-containing protein [Candidatus Odinarchaeota archaeon]
MKQKTCFRTVICLLLVFILFFSIYQSIGGVLNSKSGSPNEIPVLRNESVITDQNTGQEVVIGSELHSEIVQSKISGVSSGDQVLYLPMNEDTGSTAHDYSGYSNDGDIHGAKWTKGIAGNALEFDGDEGDYVEVNPPPTLSSGNLTVSVWVYFYETPAPTSDWQYAIVCQDGVTRVFQLITRNGKFTLNLFGSGNDVTGLELIEAHRWYHVCATFNGTTYKLYVDGAFNEQQIGALNIDNSVPVHIGQKNDGTFSFDGKIDEVAIYDRALSSTEIWGLYEQFKDPTLVLHFPMDEESDYTVHDQSIYVNDGIIYGTESRDNSINGKALEFDSYTYVTVANDGSLNPTSEITVMAWVYAYDWDGNRRILQKGFDDDQYSLLAEDSYLRFNLTGVSNGQVQCSLPSTKNWHHIAGTYDGADIKIYVDGNLENYQSAFGSMNTVSDDLYIGTKHSGAPESDFFYGFIDEVRIYNRSLSSTEIQDHYDQYKDTSLVLDLPMDTISDSKVYDQSGKGNDGSVNGATLTPGVTANALMFDGISDYVEVAPPPDLSTGRLTISSWVYYKETPISNDYGNAIICQDNDITRVFQLSTYQGKFCWHRMGYPSSDLLGEDSIEAHRWYHVVVTFDHNKHELFVDGMSQGVILENDPIAFNETVPINIGRKNSGEFYFNGCIDEVLIWNRALNEAEIQHLYKEQAPKIQYMDYEDKLDSWNGKYYNKLVISIRFHLLLPGNYSFYLELQYSGRLVSDTYEYTYPDMGTKNIQFEYAAEDIIDTNKLDYRGGVINLGYLTISKSEDGDWKQLFDLSDIGSTREYKRSDFSLPAVEFAGSIVEHVDYYGAERMLVIEFSFEFHKSAQYWAELEISDSEDNTWYSSTEIEFYSSGSYEWFIFRFPGTQILDYGYKGGQFNFDTLVVYNDDTGDLVWEESNLGSTQHHTIEDFESDGGGGDNITFTSPGFEFLLAVLLLTTLPLVRKKK